MTETNPARIPGCVIRPLPDSQHVAAAQMAITVSPTNAPQTAGLRDELIEVMWQPQNLVSLTKREWGPKGCRLTVSFMESISTALRARILAAANQWSKHANIEFTWTAGNGQVRVTRSGNQYASYLGTDLLVVPSNQPTLWLGGFSELTPDSEFDRVIPHEFGHAAGFVHEHLREAIIRRLDVPRTIAFFRSEYGWSESQTRDNVLVPLEEWSIRGSPDADESSVMCYQLPGSITLDGQPILGGQKIDSIDATWSAKIYPKPVPLGPEITVSQTLEPGSYKLTRK